MLESLPRPLRTADDPVGVVRHLHACLARVGFDLPVRLWDGTTLGPDDASYRLILRDPWTVRSLLPVSDLAAGEAYITGDLDVEGSLIDALHHIASLRDLESLGLRTVLAVARDTWSLPAPPPRDLAGRAHLDGRVHALERDAAAVRHHYDVGNDFYRRILDEQLVYSCAIFDAAEAAAPATDQTALNRAQVRKLDTVCRKLHLQPGERLLDIGCGWGALVLHAARYYDVEAVGITLSPRQAEFARERTVAEGLEHRVEIRVADYRGIDDTFDAVASVGMVEHVGHEELSNYVQAVSRVLGPGGRLLNHGITTGRRTEVRDFSRDRDSFIGSYVFPDGALVPVHEIVRVLLAGGFEIRDVEELRPHYALTLRHWVANLERSWDDVVADVGERTARVWRAYMSGSVVGFETGTLGVVQTLAVRSDAVLPLGRAWMAPIRPAPAAA
jgi:cyclopropane-fatty-acyl-phospholipid synthase